MEGKVAIVTGGVSGIGRAIADRLAERGYTVIVCDINREKGEALEKASHKVQGAYVFKYCNVGEEKDIKRVVEEVERDYGGISVLVNNAGIIRRRKEEEIKISDWDDVFEINARGTFIFCKYVSEVMKKQKSGRIINISSVASKMGDITSAPGYGPSKAAVNGLTKTFARELSPYGITVNAVAPHAIETEMSAEWSEEMRQKIISEIPLKRLGKPLEVAAVVEFLISDEAGFITGEIIDVNGGFLMD